MLSHLTDIFRKVIGNWGFSSKSQNKSFKKPLALTLGLILVFPVVAIYMTQNEFIDKKSIELISKRNTKGRKDIVISVKNKDEIFIEFVDKKQYSLTELKDEIQFLIKDQSKGTQEYIFLRTDSTVPMDLISKIIDKLKEIGVSKLILITEIAIPIELEKTVGEDIAKIDDENNIDEVNKFEDNDNANKIAIRQRFLTIIPSYANVRNGPGIRYSVLFVVKKGEIVLTGDEQKGNWIKIINQEGQEGWISGDLIRDLNDNL